jgi:hypothetical protein
MRLSAIRFLMNFGSQLIDNVKFRDSFVMLGQRGIAKGKAFEFVIDFYIDKFI